MNCPNCGLANADSAKFCANCGTPLATAAQQPPVYPSEPRYQTPPPYQAPGASARSGPPGAGNTTGKNIAIGCLIALLVVLFFGLSCTRACFGRRHHNYIHRHY